MIKKDNLEMQANLIELSSDEEKAVVGGAATSALIYGFGSGYAQSSDRLTNGIINAGFGLAGVGTGLIASELALGPAGLAAAGLKD